VLSYILLTGGVFILVAHFGGRWRQVRPSLLVHFASWVPVGAAAVVFYSTLNGLMPPLA
jgi:hypothetical protein